MASIIMLKGLGEIKSLAVVPSNNANIVNYANKVNTVPKSSFWSFISSCWQPCVKQTIVIESTAVVVEHTVLELVEDNTKTAICVTKGFDKEEKQVMIETFDKTVTCIEKALFHESLPNIIVTHKSLPQEVAELDGIYLTHRSLPNGLNESDDIHLTYKSVPNGVNESDDMYLTHRSVPNGLDESDDMYLTHIASPHELVFHVFDNIVAVPGDVDLTHKISPHEVVILFSNQKVETSRDMYLTHIISPHEVVIIASEQKVAASGDMHLTSE